MTVAAGRAGTSGAGLYPGSICDVAGLVAGHFTDARRPTGCSVVICEAGAVAGVDVRGGSPGTRETALLRPENRVEQVHAVLLTGGSAFGLDAAGGVMRWLDARGVGLLVGPADAAQPIRVPIVPAAVLFDLWLGDPRIRPGAEAGHAACTAASGEAPAQGSVGAGAGATVGKLFGIGRAMKGGIGTASIRVGGFTVGALVAVNAIGDVLGEDGRPLAGARNIDGGGLHDSVNAILRGDGPALALAQSLDATATTIGVVATDARLSKAQAGQLAVLAQAGVARSIAPLTPHDGDTLFALATGQRPLARSNNSGSGGANDASDNGRLIALGAIAAEAVARAIRNAVRSADSARTPGLLAWQDLAHAAPKP